MRKSLQLVVWTALIAVAPAFSADAAVLRNGYTIRHEHRQIIGTLTRLYLDGNKANFVDVPTAEIDHFEELPPEATPALTADLANNEMNRTSVAPLNIARPTDFSKPDLGPTDLSEVIKNASGTYRLDPDLVNSVIKAESGFNIRAISPKGAQGLMQLMPQTASQLGVQNAFDPQANVEGGTRYLRELLERYNFDLVKALAAYNAGPQRVEQYGGVPPYYETKAYVARIIRDFNKKKLAAQAAARPTYPANAAKKAAGNSSGTK
jgi:soluble lytic murein transglycosylase-like protein